MVCAESAQVSQGHLGSREMDVRVNVIIASLMQLSCVMLQMTIAYIHAAICVLLSGAVRFLYMAV